MWLSLQVPAQTSHAILPHVGAITVKLVEFVIVLQYMNLKSFTCQFAVSPRKTPTE
jgi:hypothetical protein